MNCADTRPGRATRWILPLSLALWMAIGGLGPIPGRAWSQQPPAPGTPPAPPDPAATATEDRLAAAAQMADDAVAAGQTEREKEEAAEAAAAAMEAPEIDLLELLIRGGYLMIPIGAMSLLVVAFGAERLLGLRRRKVLPPRLIIGLGQLATQKGGLNPRQAYKLCQQYPSTAANVIRTVLLKVGRPHTEVEHALSEANDREAARLYSNVRWLSLAAGISPLLGLLGTVWGMIQAFFATANLPPGANKSDYLAEGIYVALVTTFAGLAVAIPAAVLAHYLEGRIQKLFRELDEVLLGLLPQLERFEGRLRVSQDQFDQPDSKSSRTAATGEARTPPTAASPK